MDDYRAGKIGRITLERVEKELPKAEEVKETVTEE
jgi:hypothetical protein